MDDELKAMLIRLIDSFEKEAAKNAEFRAEMTGFQAGVTSFQSEMTAFRADEAAFQAEMTAFRADEAAFRVETRAQLLVINARLDEMGKRFDDQLRIMAALIPNRIAAVPPAA